MRFLNGCVIGMLKKLTVMLGVEELSDLSAFQFDRMTGIAPHDVDECLLQSN